MDAIKGTATKLVNESSTPVVMAVLLTLVVIVIVIAYLVWMMMRSKLEGRMVLRGPRRLNGQSPFVYPASKLPAMVAGQEFAFSFWIYLTDFQPTSMHKLLFCRNRSGSTGALDLRQLNPIVMLDRSSNKIHVCINTNRSPSTAPVTLNDVLTARGVNRKFVVSTIEYVPLQRWVNVVLSVQDALLTVYLDNSLYTVQSVLDMVDRAATPPTPLVGPCSGDIVVGNASSTVSSDAIGYIGNVQYWNHALSIRDASRVYNLGPTGSANSVLASMNIEVPEYGIRSPIYRVDDSNDDDSKDL